MAKLVYKYLPTERLSYLNDSQLRITQPSDLNDPFECLPAFPSVEDFSIVLNSILAEKITQIKKNVSDKNERLKLIDEATRSCKNNITKISKNEEGNIKSEFLKRAINSLNKNLGILSLSSRWDSNLMWSHYTNSHRGFCIGFDEENPFFSEYKKMVNGPRIFMPVIYTNKRIKVPIQRGIQIDFNVLLIKSEDWSYEEEKRLIVPLYEAVKKIKTQPLDINLYEMPHYLIKEIIVGTNISKENLETIREFSTLKNIELFQCKISETDFDMVRFKL